MPNHHKKKCWQSRTKLKTPTAKERKRKALWTCNLLACRPERATLTMEKKVSPVCITTAMLMNEWWSDKHTYRNAGHWIGRDQTGRCESLSRGCAFCLRRLPFRRLVSLAMPDLKTPYSTATRCSGEGRDLLWLSSCLSTALMSAQPLHGRSMATSQHEVRRVLVF